MVGCYCWVPWWGAIAGCHGGVGGMPLVRCHSRVPLLGAISGCHGRALLLGAMGCRWWDAIIGCHSRLPWSGAMGVMVGCHCWVSLLGANVLRCTFLYIDNRQIVLCYLGSMQV